LQKLEKVSRRWLFENLSKPSAKALTNALQLQVASVRNVSNFRKPSDAILADGPFGHPLFTSCGKPSECPIQIEDSCVENCKHTIHANIPKDE
jgi:hypothetical protein